MCGVGVVLFLEETNHVSMKYAVGKGTNNRNNSLLHGLVKCTLGGGVDKLQFLGDLKLLMDWENAKFQIENLVLIPIMNRVLELKGKFSEITLTFIGNNLSR